MSPRPPAWMVDPSWPWAPELADDDELYPIAHRRYLATHPAPADANRFELLHEVSHLQDQLALAHTRSVRLAFELHRTRRGVGAPPPAFELTPSAAPAHKGGHPGHRARNDRLLALFEATPDNLPHLQRCRMAALAHRQHTAADTGVPLHRVRDMPATTARDAIAEARRHRDSLPPR